MQILAISNEPSSKLESFIKDQGITYTVGASTDALGVYGGGGIPHAYLIGADGVVMWHGHPGSLPETEIEKALRSTFSLRDVAQELKPAAEAFEKGKLGDARSLAEAAKAKGGRDVEADADYILGRIQEFVASWKQASEQQDNPLDALEALALIQEHLAGTDEATAAAAKEKELRADTKVKTELDAAKKLDKLIKSVRKAEGDERKLKPIRKKLMKFIETYSLTSTAKRAQQVLDSITK